MKHRFLFLRSCNLLIAIILGACTLGPFSARDVSVWVAQPAQGAVLPLGDINVIGKAGVSHPRAALRDMTFFANGIFIGRDSSLEVTGVPPFPIFFYDGDIVWTPETPGEYFLQVMSSRRVAVSDPVRVCIIDFTFPIPETDDLVGPFGYEGPCPIPDRDEFATPGEQSLTVDASPDTLLYRPYEVTCPWPEPLTFEAALMDPPEDVVFVTVDVSVTGASTGSFPGETFAYQIVLNQTDTLPSGVKMFEGSISFPDPREFLAEYLGNEPGEVIWTARAIGRDGSVILSIGPVSIPVVPCTPIIRLSITLPPVTPTPTSTPASDADCPPGTYFAPATNRCIPIQIVTSQPGGDGDGDGGGNACIEPTGGCQGGQYWSSATCSCQVFQ